MKQSIFLLAFLIVLLATSCERDPYPLEVERFDTFWYDGDNSHTRTPNDEVDFDVRVSTTDPDAEDQYITQWEFSYSVNGKFVGILQSDTGLRTNGLDFSGTVAIKNLPLPFAGGLLPGDEIEFRMWVTDNHGTAADRYYLFVLE